MTDLFGPEGDEIARQLELVLSARSKERNKHIAASRRCGTCQAVLWQIVDLPQHRVLCTRQIEFGDNVSQRVRLDKRWSFVIVTGYEAGEPEFISTACRCGWTDLRVRDVLAGVSKRETD